MKVAIIGAGNLGLSIATGILHSGGATTMYLTRRHLELLKEFEEYGNVKLTTDNREAVSASDILIFAVQPGHFADILESVKDLLHDNHVIISTITGFGIGKMESILGTERHIIRAMPNTAISVGRSMTCLCSNTKGQKRICASGIAFWMRLIRATTQGAIQLGFDAREAQELAMHTCRGAAELLITSGHHPEEEIDRVTTPMGCTIEGLNEMEHQGLSSSLIRGIVSSFDKISQIRKG